VQYITVAKALPYESENDNEIQEENAAPNQKSIRNRSDVVAVEKRQKLRREKRLALIDRVCRALNSSNEITRLAALEYSEQLEQLEDSIDDLTVSQSLLDCVVLAHRFFELEVPNLWDLEEEETGLFASWTVEHYVDNEATLFMILDYCLFPRHPRFDE
jgi:hypothetical protein